MLEELNRMFESETIKPTFDFVHIILALFIFEKYSEGLGRYRLEKELLIGSGTARSLITKLKRRVNFLTVSGDKSKRKGHILTEKGLNFLNKIKERIPIVEEGDISVLKDLTIDSQNASTCLCQIKNGANKLTNGMAQRDAAIKLNGKGATCLVYDGAKLVFKLSSITEKEKNQMKVNENVQKYFLEKSNLNLEKNDVIIIGLADNSKKARLVALNAALTLL